MDGLFEPVANRGVGNEPGISLHRIRQYLGLFGFLTVIYWLCLSNYVRFLAMESTVPGGYGFGDLLKPLLGTCLVSAVPFAVLAYSDKTWRPDDGARIIFGAGVAVYMLLSLHYKELCPMGVLFGLVPFTFSAQVGHTAGKLCRSATT